jgi:serine/threonine-protein kinase
MAADRFRSLLTPASQFTLGNLIGKGVFGDDYVAVDSRHNGDRFVVKRFDQPLTDSGRLSFVNEIVLPSMMNSGNVMLPSAIICDEKKVIGFVMPFYPRGTVGHHAIGSLGATDLSKIIFGVAATMSQLHSLRIVHRDLQPFSVYLNADGEPVIADFALAGFVDSALSGRLRSPLFTAPESRDSDGRGGLPADVYSFGMLVYSLFEKPARLHGRDAPARYWETTLREVAMGARFVKTDRVPDPLWTLIERCWAHRPDQRPTFDDIVRDLAEGDEMVVPGADVGAYGEYRKRRMAEVVEPALGRDAPRILLDVLGWKNVPLKGKEE